jgi:hypothetical protein
MPEIISACVPALLHRRKILPKQLSPSTVKETQKFKPCDNKGLLTEREVCTVKYQTEVF